MTQAPTTLDEQMDLYRAEQQALVKKYRYFYELLRGAFVVAVFIVIGVFLFTDELLPEYVANVYVTVVGAIATIVILDRRNEERLTRQRKKTLFLQLGSQSNDFALEAKRQLELEGWLQEALAQKRFPRAGWQGMVLEKADLTNAYLREADLTSAVLMDANLTRAVLTDAHLANADVSFANLTSANLGAANLTNAKLSDANLSNAKLWGANLTNTDLWAANLTGAKLQRADLTNADLTSAELSGARLDEDTVLPDSTKWKPGTGMNRFTNPNHPDFWRSDDPLSPARRWHQA